MVGTRLNEAVLGRLSAASLSQTTDLPPTTVATLTVMPGGEHWFHTPEQMAFLDEWIQSAILR